MNNVLLAKNSFLNGLIMDFSPDNTQATCMTSALNATLLTFNGNELTLQNDMGNGRVETARLPEGYIPVGTCEFGDIIYIVSYNPILNKSQIGCFPSPERNISSDEIGDLNQTLSNNDFLELKKVYTFDYNGETYIKEDKTNYIGVYTYQSKSIEIQDYKETEEGIKVIIDSEEYKLSEKSIPTGTLAKTSVKKVLLETKKLNPGDKYIIYTDDLNDLIGNSDCLSDWGEGEHEESFKNVKLHVVSIEDSGKITYLDSTTKWYDIDSDTNTDYYINYGKLNKDGTIDIDTARNLLESNWSIFSSKVSGKLAILAELETPDDFSISYTLDWLENMPATLESPNIEYVYYKLKLEPSTNGEKSINYILATKSEFSLEELSIDKFTFITKDFILEKTDDGYIPFDSSTNKGWVWDPDTDPDIDTDIIFKIPKTYITNDGFKIPIKSNALIYKLEITPAMSYGRLDYLKQELVIDFNNIGTGEVELTTWKYHNSDTTSMLTFGINSYPKPEHEIKKITLTFYDNQGCCAYYELNTNQSGGVFTELIPFDLIITNYKFKEKFKDGKKIDHYSNAVYNTEEWSVPKEETAVSDFNYIYSKLLYGVHIQVYSGHKDSEENLENVSFYRWFWTNPMYNEYYYNIDDFNDLKFLLALDCNLVFASDGLIWEDSTVNKLHESNISNTQSYRLNSLKDSTIKMAILPGLVNDYGSFNLVYNDLDSGKNDSVSDIAVKIKLSDSHITYDNYDYEWSIREEEIGNLNYISKEKSSDEFTVSFSTTDDSSGGNVITKALSELLQIKNQSIDLLVNANLYNRSYAESLQNTTISVPVYKPIINSYDDLSKLGIEYVLYAHGNSSDVRTRLYFKNGITLGVDLDNRIGLSYFTFLGHGHNELSTDVADQKFPVALNTKLDDNKNYKKLDYNEYILDLDSIWDKVTSDFSMPLFFLTYPAVCFDGGDRDDSIKIYGTDNIDKWVLYYYNLDNKPQSQCITEGSLDPRDPKLNGFLNATNTTLTPFLSINTGKYPILLNSAYHSLTGAPSDKTTYVTLRSVYYNQNKNTYWNTPYFDNFAQQLFLLLSNTYHKNSILSEKLELPLYNVISNKEFKATLIQDIGILLEEKEQSKFDIQMSGLLFNNYVNMVKGYFLNNSFADIPLSFKPTFKLFQLTLNKVVSPLILEPVRGYIKNGINYIPVSNNFKDNTFYVYSDDLLEVYENKKYLFKLKKSEYPLLIGNSNTSDDLKTSLLNHVVALLNTLKGKCNEGKPLLEKYVTRNDTMSVYNQQKAIENVLRGMTTTINNLVEENEELNDTQNLNSILKNLTFISNERAITNDYNKIAYKYWRGYANLFQIDFTPSKDISSGDISLLETSGDILTQVNALFGTLNIYVRDSVTIDNIDSPNEIAFNCGLSLNELFDYDGNSLKYKPINTSWLGLLSTKENSKVLYCIAKNYYLDSNYKIDNPTQPSYIGITKT